MTEKTEFGALLADIAGADDLLKSVPKGDDAKIAAAAEEGAGDGEKDDTDIDGKKDGEGEGLTKSIRIIGADGEEGEGVDATELLKSLVASVETNKTETLAVFGALINTVKEQGAMLKSLAAGQAALGTQGRGRKAVLTIAEKPGATDLIKSLSGEAEVEDTTGGMDRAEFMTKALSAAAAGKIAGSDPSYMETLLNKGLEIPAALRKAVFEHAGVTH